jgi:hypothetical protein
MTDPQFATAIDFTSLTKVQLLTMCGALADKVESIPGGMGDAVQNGVLTPRQANVLDVVRTVRGDAWAEQAALTINLSASAVAQANLVKDWVANFPAIPDGDWNAIKRYLLNAKLIQPAFR